MPIQYINTGSAANAGDGDSLRTAFIKVNSNFALLSNIAVTTATRFYDILPASENVYNIGSTTASWANLYVDNSIVLKDKVISINTLTNTITINGVVLTNTTAGSTPPSVYTTGTTWFDTVSGSLFVYYDGTWVQTSGSGSGGGSTNFLAIDSNVLPLTSSTYSIGSSSKLWNSVYVNQVYLGTSTLSVNAFNTLTFNGSTILGQIGPAGPQGPQGPSANQSVDTTSSVTFNSIQVVTTSRFNGAAQFEGDLRIIDNLIDLHYPPLANGSVWTIDDGYDIGFRFNHFITTASYAGLIFDRSSQHLQFFKDSFAQVTTGTYTGTYGTLEVGSIALKNSTTNITFYDGTVQTTAFQGVATTATTALFAVTATNVFGGTVQGSAVNGTTSTTQVGYLVIPQIRIDNIASYTLDINDQGKHIYCQTATSQTIVIPPNSTAQFPIGTAVTVIQNAAGSVSITTGSGVTMVLAGTEESGNRTLLPTGMITLLKVDTNTWFISGTGIN